MYYYVQEWIIVISLLGSVLFGLAAALSSVRRVHLAVSAAVLFLVLGYETRMDRWEKTVTVPIRLDMFVEIPLMILFTTVDSLAHNAGTNRRGNRLIVIAVLIVCVFVGRLFIDRRATRIYQAYVAMDRKGPQGLADPPWDGPDAVVLYRSGRKGVVCFDAFHSKELHDRLSSKNGQPVTVEYDTF